MLTNYVLLAFRNLVKHRSFTLISLFGLITGISSALVLIIYAYQELTYDRSHPNRDNLYRVYKERVTPSGNVFTYDTWVPLLPALQETYPAIVDGTRISEFPAIVSVNNNHFTETVTFADPSAFRMFNFPLERGDGFRILSRKSDIVISKAAAVRLFGKADAVGENLHARVGGTEFDLTVGGVLRDIPANSTERPEIILAFDNGKDVPDIRDSEWDGSFLDTYVMINSKEQAAQLESQFPALVKKVFDAEMATRMSWHIMPLADYHNAITGSDRAAYIMLCIAFIIVLIAVVNYVNLATVRSVERAKEIGLRKVLGATRVSLVGQFLGESMFITAIAVGCSLMLLQATMPIINSILDTSLSLRLLAEPQLLLSMLVLFLFIGILSGSFPAFFISGTRTVESIRGKMKTSGSGLLVKRVLIVLQFSLSVVLLFSTLVIYSQVTFLRAHDLGFNKENIIVIPTNADNMADPAGARIRIESLKKELLQQSQVVAVSSSDAVPSDLSMANYTMTRPDGWTDENPFRMMRLWVDEAYFPLYDIDFVEGGNFNDHMAPIDTAVRNYAIINEAAMKAFGWDTADGKKVGRRTQVVGVVKDHHYSHLGTAVQPIFFVYRSTLNQPNNFISIRLRGNPDGLISQLEEKWRTLDEARPFSWFFVDSNFAQLYRAEDRNIRIVTWFSAGAIVIACIGLLGLIGFTVNQKQKEIGIRKVLGASDAGIVFMLNREFLLLIFVAIAIALPVASYLMQQWLSGFALQTTVHWSTYILVVVATMCLALATTSARIWRAANVNPASSLRME